MNDKLAILKIVFYSDFWSGALFINEYPVLMILWNIFLLIIPFFLCLFLIKYYRRTKFKKNRQKFFAIIIWFFWFLFIPNTAYVITDVRHLANACFSNSFYHICSKNAWIVMFFFVYACVGWVSFVFLLNQMRKFINKILGGKIEFFYIWSIIPLISIGVLLGLIDRWNSWEIFLFPLEIFKSMLKYITDIAYFTNWVIFTVGLYVLYFGGNFILNVNKKNITKKR